MGIENIPKRLMAAVIGFIGGGLLSMILLGLLVSVSELDYQSVMPGALVFALIYGIVGFSFPGLGQRLFALVDW
jgi:hypothetical protein